MKVTRRNVLNQREEGFSLVELVVAMVVIAVVLMLLIGVQISAIVTVTEARKLQQATALANEALEQMRAMPWQVLSKGMYSGFLAASGGDPLVTGEYLQVDGSPIRILIAPASNDQDLTQPWQPLFDSTGSHTQVRQDPSLTGVDFTIKAYVTEGVDSATSGTLGVAVVVEWTGRDGATARTFVRSTVHQSGCGNPSTQPFLASCQDYFEGSAGTGTITMGLWATSTDESAPVTDTYPLTTPDPHSVYRATVTTASAAVAINSQQVSTGDAFLQYGGHQTDDDDIATDPINLEGFVFRDIRTASQSVTQASSAEDETTVSYSGAPSGNPQFRIRSDYARHGDSLVDMGGSCLLVGIPVGQPCATSSLDHESTALTGSGYIVMNYGGEIFRLSRPMVENYPGSNEGEAWTARFIDAPGSADRGCETLTGSGCVAAGASRTISELRIGDIRDTTWAGSAAPDGLVVIGGNSSGGCSEYRDEVRVERGPGQVGVNPFFDRCGTVNYWTSAGYVPYYLAEGSNDTLTTDTVSWTNGSYSISAISQVRVLPSSFEPNGSTDCAATSCSVTASAGSITIVTDYVLSWGTHEHALVSTTDITPTTAQASYTAGVGD
jgi:prepilin-type N-terminal cleavage/methylation domain-containing protein